MWGQWYGIVDSDQTEVLVNIDQQTPDSGRVHLASHTPRAAMSALFKIHPNGTVTIAGARNSQTQQPTFSQFKFTSFDENAVHGTYQMSWGATGSIVLHRIDALTTHAVGYRATTWDQLQSMLNSPPLNGKMIWRGQRDPTWPLSSKFHRLGRRDLTKYLERDVEEFRRLASAEGKIFDKNQPDQLEALIHMGQHHGLPTPWIDWTRSPFVAMYFAFENEGSQDGFVRIYGIDVSAWPISNLRNPSIDCATPFVELAAPNPMHNPRSVAQQAVVMATNLARPEWFIANRTLPNGSRTKLSFIEVPCGMRSEVLRRLSQLGTTPRTMYGDVGGMALEVSQRYTDPAWDAG